MRYLLLLRPHNWIKNFFIFVPLFFAQAIFTPELLTLATYAFLAFSALASCIYVINDIVDIERDRLHPKKKHRPLAAGLISPALGWLIALALLLIATALIVFIVPAILPVMLVYFIANLAYSFYFKQVPIVDILMVAGFYVLRVSAGALAVDVQISGWLLLATIFVALFLVIGKRKAELIASDGKDTRAVLQQYTPEFLNLLMSMSVVMMLVIYSVYTVLVLSSHRGVYSIFFVLLGVFRYLYLSYNGNETEQPEQIIFSDFWIFISAIGWIAFMYAVLY